MSAVWVVAVTELRGSAEDAAKELAPTLGTTAYELRLNLAIGPPTVVLFTPEETRARSACAAFVRAGHRAVCCLRSEAVPSASMTALKDFRFEPSALVANVGSSEVLPFTDISLLARATHRVTTETTVEVKERKLRPVMAIASGGLVTSKTTTKEVTSKTEAREQVLYLFRASGAPAWILRERGARYGGLGAEASRTSLENFATVVRKLRDAAPGAVFDERLLGSRPVRGVPDAILSVDLLAHILSVDVAAR